VKMGGDGGGSLISPDGVAPSRIVRVSASVIFPCTIKSRRKFLLAPAHQDSPGKGRVYVCVPTVRHSRVHLGVHRRWVSCCGLLKAN